MKKTFLSIMLLLLFADIKSNSTSLTEAILISRTQVNADAPLCGIKSDQRYYFFEEGLYEFSITESNVGNAKLSICIEGTEASGRCREDNFNVPWRFYVDKGLSISIWKSFRKKVKGDDGKMHTVYSAPEETGILKENGVKNYKDWKGTILKWEEADSTGKVNFKMNIKVKKIK